MCACEMPFFDSIPLYMSHQPLILKVQNFVSGDKLFSVLTLSNETIQIFAEDILRATQMIKFIYKRVENISRKEKNVVSSISSSANHVFKTRLTQDFW